MFLWHVARTNCPRQAEIQQCPNPEGWRGAQQKPGQLVGDPSRYVKEKTPPWVLEIHSSKQSCLENGPWMKLYLFIGKGSTPVCMLIYQAMRWYVSFSSVGLKCSNESKCNSRFLFEGFTSSMFMNPSKSWELQSLHTWCCGWCLSKSHGNAAMMRYISDCLKDMFHHFLQNNAS